MKVVPMQAPAPSAATEVILSWPRFTFLRPAGKGTVGLSSLSPGAASYDLFTNYVAKAAAFCSAIDGLPGAVSASN